MANSAQTTITTPAITPAASGPRWSKTTVQLARRLKLNLVRADELVWCRTRHGQRFRYLDETGALLRERSVVARLAALAVPPAYEDVRYAPDPAAHLQAVGRDAAGRLQYRYHPDWDRVRELRKARRLARIVDALPRVRRRVARILSGDEPSRDFALAAVVELIAHGNPTRARIVYPHSRNARRDHTPEVACVGRG